MNESILAYVSGLLTVTPPSFRPFTTSNDETCGEVGDEVGDDEGVIAVLIFVVRVRRMGILK